MFISESNPNNIVGVRRVLYQTPKPNQEQVHPVVRDFDLAARRAEIVAGLAGNLKRLGFTPDIIMGHHGWGELLDIRDVYPDTPLLGYFEFYYATDGQDVFYDKEFPIGPDRFPRIRAMNVINHLALALDQHGQTPTQWQLTRYPDWAQQRIRVIREGARLDVCKPNPEARREEFAIGEFRVAPAREARHLRRAQPGAVSRLSHHDAHAARPDGGAAGPEGGDGRRRRRELWRAAVGGHLARASAEGAGREIRCQPPAAARPDPVRTSICGCCNGRIRMSI